jgi:hypothetical protein
MEEAGPATENLHSQSLEGRKAYWQAWAAEGERRAAEQLCMRWGAHASTKSTPEFTSPLTTPRRRDVYPV